MMHMEKHSSHDVLQWRIVFVDENIIATIKINDECDIYRARRKCSSSHFHYTPISILTYSTKFMHHRQKKQSLAHVTRMLTQLNLARAHWPKFVRPTNSRKNTLPQLLHTTMFRAARTARVNLKRFYSADHHTPAPSHNEIDATKVFGIALLAGVSLYFYKSTKEPVIKTPLYNQSDDRAQLRDEAYVKRYKTSFIKTFIRDKGGIGQRQFRREIQGAVPHVLIPAPSPYGEQFGAGIKTDKLGPRKERVRYFAPLEN